MINLFLIPQQEFTRVREASLDRYEKLALIADMCRANTLATVKRAGSGHLGSSFSSLDIVTFLYYSELNTPSIGIKNPDRDVYFSSKGHDVPGLYAVLFSLGILPKEKFLKLRRLGGTYGHPDIGTPGIEANTGSLGMGISKAKGIAFAKQLAGHGGRVFVMTGDGELQEGQNYEAFQTAVHQKITNLTVITDHNKLQSDKLITEISDIGDLEAKLKAFGWHVARCDGHDFNQLEKVFSEFRTVTGKPKILIADTLKGRGVSFMEHPQALRDGNGCYRWHAGAPDDDSFNRAYEELVSSINKRLAQNKLTCLQLEPVAPEPAQSGSVSSEYVGKVFGETLLDIVGKRKDVVVLDADLAMDCHIRNIELKYPDRFIENGIAEQDMVSMAGGLALQGFLPVVNTFASFLAARANEQIYNNACERTRIIYAAHYSGLIPAGPGQSHQSIRDISLFGALTNFLLLEPSNAIETRMIVEYCIEQARENCVIRLVIGPSPRVIELPEDYRWVEGRGAALSEGRDACLFAYGPVMLHEALKAHDILAQNGFGLKVINMPWLNRVDRKWLGEILDSAPSIYVLEDHAPFGGLGDFLLNALVSSQLLQGKSFRKFAVEGHPACGTPKEVLHYHALDGELIAQNILVQCQHRN